MALAMSLCATIGVAQQIVTQKPVIDREQLQGQAKMVWIQDLNLSDEQEAQIAAIRKEYRPKIDQSAKELKNLAKEEVDQIKGVFTPEQKPKIQAMIEERKEFKEESLAQTIASLKELDLTEAEHAKIAEIRKEFRPKIDEAARQLEGLLNETQKMARDEAVKADKTHREVLQSLNLTSAQKTELENIGKQLKDLVGNELAKIQGVLTEEQRETLQDLRSERKELVRDRLAEQIANFKDLNLTQPQKDSLMKIRQEFRPKIHEVGNNLRATIGEEARKIVEVLKPAGSVAQRPESVR
jgi:Spy/CpxP family protein refolding chaperone